MTIAFQGAVHSGQGSPNSPPLDPTAEQARLQLLHELAKLGYQEAKPTWIDDVVNWVGGLFNSLFDHIGTPAGGSSLIVVVIAVAVIAAAVIGFLVFGLPRINRRTSITGSLFGDDDDRNSGALREAALRAAAAGDFTTAIEELFRSIARGLAERTVVTTFPGTTAHGFAREAERPFPEFGADLRLAADSFDAVRYLGATGTEAQWIGIKTLEVELRSARPALDPVDA
ncbi:MAG TPA: DUF4129 domain-containing protein [Galbitalea sp.]|jgi:hypothetical protein|nr:DUF4129 domain-containing protein [Galbitalea sp.]